MARLLFAVVLGFCSIPGVAWGVPGAAPLGSAIGEYDPDTGEIVVSVSGVNNWYVEHLGTASMTGDAPLGLPNSGGLLTDNDFRVGESSFDVFSFTDLNLGNVAAPLLPADGKLQIFWNTGLGSALQSDFVFHPGLSNVAPTAGINGPFVANTYVDPYNIYLDAGSSTDDGLNQPLTYKWDLDNDGTFEVDTGTSDTYEMVDVNSFYGGLGTYPVSVEVYDGEYWDVASTTIELIYDPPVNMQPSAHLNGPYSVNTFSDPLNISLDAGGSTDDGLDGPLSFAWDLDNDGTFEVNTGQVSSLPIADVTSTFGGLGSFPVAVKAFDGSLFDVASTTVDLFYELPPENTAPTAEIDGPLAVNTFSDPLNILLNARGTTDDGLDGPLSFEWDLDNDGTFEVSTGQTPYLPIADVTSTFGDLGSFPVAVKAFDGSLSDIASTLVDITYEEFNSVPNANINQSSYTIYIDQSDLSVLLNADSSSDDGLNQPLVFAWDLDNDGIFEVDTGLLATLSIADVTATFGGIGNYAIAVEVFDGEFSDVDGATVRLKNTPPPPVPEFISATYDPSTGEITISVSGLINWYIESASMGLTGDTPAGLPGGAGLVTDNDTRIGESAFAQFAYDLNLGNVAETGLPWNDLTLHWNASLGGALQSTPVLPFGGFIPEPTGLVLLVVGVMGLGCFRGRFIYSR